MCLFHYFSALRVCSLKCGEGNVTPLQHSCLENPLDGRALQAAVHGVAQSWTRLSDFTFTFMHWRRKWQPTPVFLPGESQGRGSLVGCHLWGCTESDTTEETQQQQQQLKMIMWYYTIKRISFYGKNDIHFGDLSSITSQLSF